MVERRLPRLLLEIGFLAALAAALALSGLRPAEVAGVEALGWLLAVVFEWGALRGRPSFGRGLPPRYRLPRLVLPPPRPLEQFGAGYPAGPGAGDEATWIASPALLAEWPVAERTPAQAASVDEETRVLDVLDEELAFTAAEHAARVAEDGQDDGRRPEPEEVELEAEPAPAPDATPPAVGASVPPAGLARHRIDPLADRPRSRRFGRRPVAEPASVEVPGRPQRLRLPPPSQRRGEEPRS